MIIPHFRNHYIQFLYILVTCIMLQIKQYHVHKLNLDNTSVSSMVYVSQQQSPPSQMLVRVFHLGQEVESIVTCPVPVDTNTYINGIGHHLGRFVNVRCYKHWCIYEHRFNLVNQLVKGLRYNTSKVLNFIVIACIPDIRSSY